MIWPGAGAGVAAAAAVWWAARLLCRTAAGRARVGGAMLAALAVYGAGSGAVIAWRITGAAAALFGLFAAVVAAAAAVDAAEMRLPDVLTLPLAGTAVLLLPWLDGLHGWGLLRPAAGVLVAGAWAFGVAVLADQSLGDVKLAAGIGGWLAWESWAALAAGMLVGQILVAGGIAARMWSRRRAGLAPADTPLGPALVAGAMIGLLIGAAA